MNIMNIMSKTSQHAPTKVGKVGLAIALWGALLGTSTHVYSDTTLKMNGIAEYTSLRKSHYIGAIFLPTAISDPVNILASDQDRKLEMHITLDKWRGWKFANMLREQININNQNESDFFSIQGATGDLENFYQLFKAHNLQAGDNLIVTAAKEGGTSISLNETQLLETSNDSLFNVLLRVWIGKIPPSREFKQGILVMPNETLVSTLNAKWSAHTPSSERKKEIAEWTQHEQQQKQEKQKKQDMLLADATKKDRMVSNETLTQAPKKEVVTTKTPKLTRAANKLINDTTEAFPTAASKSATIQKMQETKASPKSKMEKTIIQPVQVASLTNNFLPIASTNAPLASPNMNALENTLNSQTNAHKDSIEKKKSATEASTLNKPSKEDKPTSADKTSEASDKTLLDYKGTVRKITSNNIEYPSIAYKHKHQGTAILWVQINRNGKLKTVNVVEPSKYKSLNSAAKKAAQHAIFPKIPDQIKGDTVALLIPITFRIPQ